MNKDLKCECMVTPSYSPMTLGIPSAQRCKNPAIYLAEGITEEEKAGGLMGLCQEHMEYFKYENPEYTIKERENE